MRPVTIRDPGGRGTPRPSSTVNTLTENTSLCVKLFVRCSLELLERPTNPITNPNPVYNHAHTYDSMLTHKTRDVRQELKKKL
jgi:hypothetical protein